MSGWDGEHYPPSRPRRAAGGIKARSKRGPIGEQWWSRRFIEVLESLGLASRLSRGRSYARSGQVLALDIGTGHVTATVQGSRPKPYKVRLTVVPLTTQQWVAVEEALAARAVFRARLLAGEMPAEIEEVFADCGTPLFPRTARDLAMTCTCPDWEVPCKHLAAVCYVLAEAFDDNPFALLAWRGKGREDLLAALRRPAGGRDATGTRPVIDVIDRPLADFVGGGIRGVAAPGQHSGGPRGGVPPDQHSFWESSLSPARLRSLPPALPAPPDLLLRSVAPPLLTAGGRDLPTLLRPAYVAMASEAGEPDPPQ